MSEQIVTGKKYKILADATNKVWHVISFISQAVDVFFSNGKNAQTTLGSITGISDSLTSTSSNVAASAASVKALNDKITELSSNLACKDIIVKNSTENIFSTPLQSIDLTNIKNITVKVGTMTFPGDSHVWVFKIFDSNNVIVNRLDFTSANTTKTLDVSALTGDYYWLTYWDYYDRGTATISFE